MLPASIEGRMTGPALKAVAFVDDDADLRESNRQMLELAGFEPIMFDTAESALARISADFAGVVVSDIRMPGMDGLQLFAALRERDAALPVLLITGHGDVPTAVAAIRDGAYDFITKPYAAEDLVRSVTRALDRRRVELENRNLRAAAERAASASALIGVSPPIEQLRRTIVQIAEADVDILIEGETGTGKTLVASMVHRASARRRRPMITVDCGALPESLMDSELFGHLPDAFPGARSSRTGKIEAANHGTLFLDEVDLLPLSAQPKLLRACADRVVVPLGGNELRSIDFRLIASSRRPLAERAAEGAFLDALLYRLNGIVLHLPPLRQRPEDVPILFTHFLELASDRLTRPVPKIGESIWRVLHAHDWPGNVRELYNYAERTIMGLADTLGPAAARPRGLVQEVEQFEAQQIRQALATTRGNVTEALELLKLPRKTFYDKVRRHNIHPRDWRR
jgi:two-component system C4-dicarboxylate transport response regulator DctD